MNRIVCYLCWTQELVLSQTGERSSEEETMEDVWV